MKHYDSKKHKIDATSMLLTVMIALVIQVLIFTYAMNVVLPKLTNGRVKSFTYLEAVCLLIVSSMIFGKCCTMVA